MIQKNCIHKSLPSIPAIALNFLDSGMNLEVSFNCQDCIPINYFLQQVEPLLCVYHCDIMIYNKKYTFGLCLKPLEFTK